MKNKPFIWKIVAYFFSFFLFFGIFIPAAQAEDLNLNGSWKSSNGNTVEVSEDGSSANGTITSVEKSDIQSAAKVGDPAFKGNIVGSTFSGSIFLRALARNCSQLDGFYPSTGTMSPDGNTLTFHWEDKRYNLSDCQPSGRVFQGITTYTRIAVSITPSPTSIKTNAVPSVSQKDQSSIKNETVCHESCQSDYDGCASQCKSQNGTSADDFDRWLKECSNRPLPKTRKELEEQERQDENPNSPCYTGQRFVCNKAPDDTCLPGTERFEKIGEPKNNDKSSKSSNESCFSKCEQARSKCDQRCREAEQTVNITKPSEKPSVGLSSNNFKELAQANAEYQIAQAYLENVKRSNDPKWEAKKDFAGDYNAAVKAVSGDENLRALRTTLEEMHEIVSKGKDWQEFGETLNSVKKGEFGSYGKLDLFTDTVKSFNDYQDLRAKGISAKDATTKATLDNYGSSVLTLIPVLKAIDVVTTTPDSILNTLGVDEKNWSRKYVTDGFIGKFAPSGVVKQTTDLMIEDNWSDIGNALKFGWNKMVNADGIGAKTWESGKLLAGTIGAVPVAIARGVSDLAGGGISIGEKAAGFVSYLFTW